MSYYLLDSFDGLGPLTSHIPTECPIGSSWAIINGTFGDLGGSVLPYISGNYGIALIDIGSDNFELTWRSKYLAGGWMEHGGIALRSNAIGNDYYAIDMMYNPVAGKASIYGVPGHQVVFDPVNQSNNGGSHYFSGIDGQSYVWTVLMYGGDYAVYDNNRNLMLRAFDATKTGQYYIGPFNMQGGYQTNWDYIQVKPSNTDFPWKSFSLSGDSISNTTYTQWSGLVVAKYTGVARYQGLWLAKNHAVSGSTIQYHMAGQITSCISDNADFTIIALGTNDGATDDQAIYYGQLIRLWNALGKPIYCMGVLPKTVDNTRDVQNGWISGAVNQAIAAGVDVTYWNTDGWIDPVTETTDGLHPTDEGQAKIATRVLALLPAWGVSTSCAVTVPESQNTSDRYFIVIRDINGRKRFVLDNQISVSYNKKRYEAEDFTLVLDGNKHASIINSLHNGLDWRVEIMRSVPGCGVNWYKEFEGLYRSPDFDYSEKTSGIFTASGEGLKGLLRRRIIGYRAGTTGADKDCNALQAMREYVLQNCGIDATYQNGLNREAGNGVIPGFSIDESYQTSQGDITWSGSKEGEVLLDTLKAIAEEKKLDFWVESTNECGDIASIVAGIKNDGGPDYTNLYDLTGNPGGFVFKCKDFFIGSDKTISTNEDNPNPGRNLSGNVPIVFSYRNKNISGWRFKKDRGSEITRVIVFGSGDSLVRDWVSRNGDSIVDSPLNICEAVKSGSNQEYQFQLEQIAQDELAKALPKDNIEFIPVQTPNCLYGKHYFFGDLVTFSAGFIRSNFIISGVHNTIDGGGSNITFDLEYFTYKEENINGD